jgi:hypothetical protein
MKAIKASRLQLNAQRAKANFFIDVVQAPIVTSSAESEAKPEHNRRGFLQVIETEGIELQFKPPYNWKGVGIRFVLGGKIFGHGNGGMFCRLDF